MQSGIFDKLKYLEFKFVYGKTIVNNIERLQTWENMENMGKYQ